MPIILIQIMICKELNLFGFDFSPGANFSFNKLTNAFYWCSLINNINQFLIDEFGFGLSHVFYALGEGE